MTDRTITIKKIKKSEASAIVINNKLHLKDGIIPIILQFCNHKQVFIAYINNKPIGVSILTLKAYSNFWGYNTCVYVKPRFRKLGVGKALLQHFNVPLSGYYHNKSARLFFQKAGVLKGDYSSGFCCKTKS